MHKKSNPKFMSNQLKTYNETQSRKEFCTTILINHQTNQLKN